MRNNSTGATPSEFLTTIFPVRCPNVSRSSTADHREFRTLSYQPCGNSGDGPSEAFNRLAEVAIPIYHPKRAALFAEGQPSRGIFILYSGRVKVFTSSTAGKIFILRFANPGEILGLAGTLLSQPYEAWAEAIQPTQSGFIEHGQLLHLMRHRSEIAMQVAMQLGEFYCSAIAGVRAMGLAQSASQKLAIFLLNWCARNRPLHDEAGALFTLTQGEIAQAVGISRETVSRILSGFKKRGLIRWKGRNLVLTDKSALENSAAM
jgi:CRP/FNR family transcriptional regulator, cyclic AMP receptor protein